MAARVLLSIDPHTFCRHKFFSDCFIRVAGENTELVVYGFVQEQMTAKVRPSGKWIQL
jgi:hypothetical protein